MKMFLKCYWTHVDIFFFDAFSQNAEEQIKFKIIIFSFSPSDYKIVALLDSKLLSIVSTMNFAIRLDHKLPVFRTVNFESGLESGL